MYNELPALQNTNQRPKLFPSSGQLCILVPVRCATVFNTMIILYGGWRSPLVSPIWTKTFSNTLGPSQHRRRFADDIFKCIFFNENCCILIEISLKYVRKVPIDNNPALVQTMAWRRLGDNPFSEPMMVSLPTHICVTRPQWVDGD